MCWYFYLITLFLSIHSQYIYESLIYRSSQGQQYLPIEYASQLVSINYYNSMNECFYACNKNILCRIFDYGSNIPGQCRLFEGDTNQLGSIIPSSLSNSFVGVIKITPSLYTQYGKSCSSICKESRYLICNNQSICECAPHSYWNSSQGICLAQTPKLGAPCEQNMNMCREDLNYTCLQFNSCGPLSVLSGTTIADSNSSIEGSSTIGMNLPVGIKIYDIQNESLLVIDVYNEQIIKITNANSNNRNMSVLIHPSWSSGLGFLYPMDMLIDMNNQSNLYVSDYGNNRILMFYSMSDSTQPLTVIDGLPTYMSPTNNILQGPYGIVQDKQGKLYIADYYNNRIIMWSTNATVFAGTGLPGNTSLDLNSPSGLFIDTLNSLLYVTDANNHRIQLFYLNQSIPANGITVAGGNGPGNASHQLNQPSYVWVSNKTDYIYIADTSNNRIQRWKKGATSGVTIAGDPYGNPGTNSISLNQPNALIINNNETRIYVTDSFNSRIQRFDLI